MDPKTRRLVSLRGCDHRTEALGVSCRCNAYNAVVGHFYCGCFYASPKSRRGLRVVYAEFYPNIRRANCRQGPLENGPRLAVARAAIAAQFMKWKQKKGRL